MAAPLGHSLNLSEYEPWTYLKMVTGLVGLSRVDDCTHGDQGEGEEDEDEDEELISGHSEREMEASRAVDSNSNLK